MALKEEPAVGGVGVRGARCGVCAGAGCATARITAPRLSRKVVLLALLCGAVLCVTQSCAG